jgi:hypothetical protein
MYNLIHRRITASTRMKTQMMMTSVSQTKTKKTSMEVTLNWGQKDKNRVKRIFVGIILRFNASKEKTERHCQTVFGR